MKPQEQRLATAQEIVLWLESLKTEYTEDLDHSNAETLRKFQLRKEIEELRSLFLGEVASGTTIETIRLLLAATITKWYGEHNVPTDRFSNVLLQEVVVALLWALVTAPGMPADWSFAVRQITSVEVETLVMTLRDMMKHKAQKTVLDHLILELKHDKYKMGILNLLIDLSHPDIGGRKIILLSVLSGDASGESKLKEVKNIIVWLLVGAAAGVVGNRSDAALLQLLQMTWESLELNNEQNDNIDAPPDIPFIEAGVKYENKSDFKRAISQYSTAIALNSKSAKAYAYRANAYRLIGQYNKSLVDFNRALQLNYDKHFIFHMRALLYKDNKQYNLAEMEFQRAEEADPACCDLYFHRGLMYSSLEENEKAMIEFTKAVKCKPNFWAAYRERGKLIHKDNRLREAAMKERQALLDNTALGRFLKRRGSKRKK